MIIVFNIKKANYYAIENMHFIDFNASRRNGFAG